VCWLTKFWVFIALGLLWARPSLAREPVPFAPETKVEPQVAYTLHVTLQEPTPDRYVLAGHGTVTLHNTSATSVDSLPLHLYMNAFAPGSAALGMPFLDGRAAFSLPGDQRGSIELHAVRDTRDGTVLPVTFPTPEGDHTTATVVLAQPVAPGARAQFELVWTTELPTLRQRTGSVGSFVFAGQWFPKLAKLELDGSWVQFVFHPQAEFYANFGSYDVTLDTPQAYVLGASGVLQSETQQGDRRVSRYVSTNVHDFAWTAWPEFLVHEFTLDDTNVRVLYPPGNELNRETTQRTITLALPWFERWLGPYRLPNLTIVHPPRFASAAGGMEYPGLLTTGGARLTSLVTNDVERVVIHELAHQWFYGSVASNEYEWPFLDEGLSMYAENRAMRELYEGPTAETQRFATTLAQTVKAYESRHDAAISSPAAAFTSFDQLAALAYDRAALVFETFANVYGPGFDRALGEYARTYAGHHPEPNDLFNVLGRHLEPRAVENLRRSLMHRGWINNRVESLVNTAAPTDSTQVLNRILVTRQGTLDLPVVVTLTDTRGEVRREIWADAAPQREILITTQDPIETACIDAERSILIDDEPADNCKRQRLPSPPPYWVELLLALQTLLSMLSW
jgi:hypothetical protein